MTLRGLPPIDVPKHLREPKSCKWCKHSFYESSDTDLRYLRCSRTSRNTLCVFERDETGECGPDARHWKERGI